MENSTITIIERQTVDYLQRKSSLIDQPFSFDKRLFKHEQKLSTGRLVKGDPCGPVPTELRPTIPTKVLDSYRWYEEHDNCEGGTHLAAVVLGSYQIFYVRFFFEGAADSYWEFYDSEGEEICQIKGSPTSPWIKTFSSIQEIRRDCNPGLFLTEASSQSELGTAPRRRNAGTPKPAPLEIVVYRESGEKCRSTQPGEMLAKPLDNDGYYFNGKIESAGLRFAITCTVLGWSTPVVDGEISGDAFTVEIRSNDGALWAKLTAVLSASETGSYSASKIFEAPNGLKYQATCRFHPLAVKVI